MTRLRDVPARGKATPQRILLDWYAATGRDLPWRRTRDPYRILVSEVMLQQTQVDRVIPFYERFLTAFPTAQALAAADDDTLHRLWKGLGYPSRVDRLREAARAVIVRGSWPDTPEALRELPGLGPYTSHSVACFAFHRDVPVVDTNIARVYARRDGLALPLKPAEAWAHATTQVPPGESAPYHNALMDLGATVCTARAPRCTICPWIGTRLTATSNPLKPPSKVVTYGDPAPKRGTPRTHIVLGLIHHDGRYLVTKRPPGVHLPGAWELPGGKREPQEDDRVALSRELQEELGVEVLAARHLMTWHHAYPDKTLTFHLYRVRLFDAAAARPLVATDLRWLTPDEFLDLDFPPANAPIQARLRRYHRR
jgi:A/G-specific adenine glycosylase